MKKHFILLLCSLLCLIALTSVTAPRLYAQQRPDSTGIKKLLDKAEAWQKALSPEKIYLNFDKPYYAAGDTAWLKAYVLMDNKASTYSGKLYVELLNSTGKMVKRLTLPVASGLGTGYFPLDAKTIAEDSYTIRAYTNWQQNFGAGAYFYRQFYVGKLAGKTWLVTEQNRRDISTDTNHVQLAMRFTDAKGAPLVTRQVTVRVFENGKPILKSDMSTGVDGTLTGGFSIPAKANHRALSIAVEDVADKAQRIIFPFYPAGTNGDIDLQFMPEGGNLVNGLYNKMGFKAIGEDGLGRDVKGTVVDSKGEEAATLQSLHNGMGSFVLVPQAGETYTAKLMIDGKEKRYPLPKAKEQGLALRVDGVTHADELYVYISSSTADSKSYTLIAQSADKVYFGSGFKFNADNYFNTRIKKELFPTGIISLLIIGPDNKPLNQRIVFVNHHDEMKVAATPAQASYGVQDKVSVDLHVTDNAGNPIQANFSVAVTDDAQIKDAAQGDNILSHILLAAELKGNIESPAWYFTHDDKEDDKVKDRALDNLLLTQGWQGFDWAKLDAAIPKPVYKPEPDISVNGKLTNFFGKPAKGIKVMLMSKSRHENALLDTVSDMEGRFSFSRLPVNDTVAYLIKLHNGRDKSATSGIVVDEFKPTDAKLALGTRIAPWNMNTDSTLINYINKTSQRATQAAAFGIPNAGTVLKQVDITAKRKTKYVGGTFATEIGNITEEELMAARKMSLLDLIYKKIPNFREIAHTFRTGPTTIITIFADGQDISDPNSLIGENQVLSENDKGVFTQDGDDPTSSFIGNTPPAKDRKGNPILTGDFNRMKEFLNTLGGEDVKALSLYRGDSYAYLVITTRSGQGGYASPSYGTYVYRPPYIQLPRQFYSPKYAVKSSQPDYRSTIHWEPNVVTDAAGNAKLTFYAADKPSTYTIMVEGTDMQGHFGVNTGKINIVTGVK